MRALRVGGVCVMTVIAIAACNPRKADNLPLDEAMYQTPAHLTGVQETVQAEAPAGLPDSPVEVSGRQWIASAATYTLPERMVRPVMPVEGVVFHSLAWDQDPFDRLLVEEEPGVWREFVEVR